MTTETAGWTSMGPERLVDLCGVFYTTFDPGKVTLDTHTDQCIQKHNVTHPDDQTFLRQVVYGLLRYSKLLTPLIESFLHHNR
jgi:hypothetical protein